MPHTDSQHYRIGLLESALDWLLTPDSDADHECAKQFARTALRQSNNNQEGI